MEHSNVIASRLNMALTQEERALVVEVKILALRKNQTLKAFIMESLREKIEREAEQFYAHPRLEHVKTGEQRQVSPAEVAKLLQSGEWRSMTVPATVSRAAKAK